MRESDTFFKIYLIGIVFFIFIETFCNLMVDVNAYVFMNLGEIISILPILAVTIVLTIILIISFNTKRLIKHEYRLFSILIIISVLRLIAQFIPIIWILLLIHFLQLFSCMICFNEIITLIQKGKNFLNFNTFIAAIIFGLGVQFAFFIGNISSNLTTNFTKLVPIIIIVISITVINIKFFFPKFQKNMVKEERTGNDKKQISYVHFVILGILVLTNMIWIINPMALSAYGVINFNFSGTEVYFPWISYGFTYYIFVILITAIVSFYLFTRFLLQLNKKNLKIVSLAFGVLFVLVNGLSLLFNGRNRTVGATIFFTITSIVNVGFLVYYSLYIFNSYSFNSRRKLFLGLIIFFITILFFIILQVQVLWYEYISLLINVIILVGIFAILVSLIEIYNFSKMIIDKEYNQKTPKKAVGILLIGVFLANVIVLGVVFAQRQPVPQGSNNPTFMTWNIHNGIGIDDCFDLDRLIEQIEQEDPDVLGLNEVDMGALKTSFVDIGTYFAHHLNMYYYYGYTFYKHYGNILLSKYPILNAEIIELPLSVESTEPRSMIKATLEINTSQWRVYLTHLSTEQKDREAQVPFIVNKTNEESFEKVVWMGDFNFQPTSGEYDLINSTNSLNFTDTYRSLNSDDGYTYIEDGIPQRRIDYIMCSPDLTPTQSKVKCTVGSDHCAVITTF